MTHHSAPRPTPVKKAHAFLNLRSLQFRLQLLETSSGDSDTKEAVKAFAYYQKANDSDEVCIATITQKQHIPQKNPIAMISYEGEVISKPLLVITVGEAVEHFGTNSVEIIKTARKYKSLEDINFLRSDVLKRDVYPESLGYP